MVKTNFYLYCIFYTELLLSFTMTMTSSKNSLPNTQISFIGYSGMNVLVTVKIFFLFHFWVKFLSIKEIENKEEIYLLAESFHLIFLHVYQERNIKINQL